jgi:hypothetical protein
MRTLEAALAAHPFPFELEQMQKIDIVKAAGWGRCLLDLPVGYGKTAISTAVSLMLEPETTLVLVPPILIVQWVAWLGSITGADSVVGYTGSPAQRAKLVVRGTRYLVMSYQVFLNDIDRLRKELAGRDVLTIVDECQYIKGRGKAFKGVRDFSAGRNLILMSGTIMSKPGDGYAYVKLNSPEVYRTYDQFENIHVAERNIFKQVTKWQHLDLLQANLNIARVKRTKEEVHSALPKARYIPVLYDLSKEHMALYKQLMEEQLLELPDGGKIDATNASRLHHAAQQIVTNYGYYAGDETKRSGVYDLVDALMDQIALGQAADPALGVPVSSKLILWTLYKKTSAAMLGHVNAYLEQRNDGARAVAAYSEANAKKSVAEFLGDDRTVALVAQPGSAGAGLNPQHLCWNCVFIETPTTNIPFEQSAGRIDRKGQKFNPNIYLLIARGTIQESLLKNLFSNDNLVQQASGGKQALKNLIFP